MRCSLAVVTSLFGFASAVGVRGITKRRDDKLIPVGRLLTENPDMDSAFQGEDGDFWRFLLEDEGSMSVPMVSPPGPEPTVSPPTADPPTGMEPTPTADPPEPTASPPTPGPPTEVEPTVSPPTPGEPTPAEVPTTPSVCPAVDEPCMNEENFLVCTTLVEEGCENILFLESCPLQFQCGDDQQGFPRCGGIAGIECEDTLSICYTGISDDCDEDCGDVDCEGECRQVVPDEQCGGFAGFECPEGTECVDAKGDECSPNCGGADCIGICLVVV